MRYVEKQKLMELVSNYAYEQVPKEVMEFWVKMWGQDIDIQPEPSNKPSDNSPSHRAPASNVDDKDDTNVDENSGRVQSENDVSENNEEEKL